MKKILVVAVALLISGTAAYAKPTLEERVASLEAKMPTASVDDLAAYDAYLDPKLKDLEKRVALLEAKVSRLIKILKLHQENKR